MTKEAYGYINIENSAKISLSITQGINSSYTALLLGQLEDLESCVSIYRQIDSTTMSSVIATQNYVDNKITGAINSNY